MKVDADTISKFTDMDGAVIPKNASTKPLAGITVFLKNKAGNVTEQVVTDKNGNFKFRKIPKGDHYFISLSPDKNVLVKGIALFAGKPHKGLRMNDAETKDDGSFKLEINGLQYITIEGDVFYTETNEPAQLTVFLTNETGTLSRQTVTDKTGHFKFEELPANERYTVFLSTDKSATVNGIARSGENPLKDVALNGQRTDAEGKLSLNISKKKEFECGKFFSELTGRDKADLNNPDVYAEMLNNPEVGQAVILNNIFFDFDKAALLPQSIPELNCIGELMKINTKIKIEIAGHTDSKGNYKYNRILSKGRSESVVTYLAANGIARGRLKAKWYADSKPIAPNTNTDGTDNPEGRQKNRRIEFKILPK